jgi:Spy/CpxP family protein refolding chaperone
MRSIPWIRATILTAVATLVAATALYAADPPAGDRPHRNWESRLQQKLGLTDDQVQKMRALRARDVDARRQTFTALRQAQADLRRLALNGADDNTLRAKQAEVETLMNQSLSMRVNGLRELGTILTPDQREAFATMLDHGPRHHRRHGPPPTQQPS